jgi:hypothetical protein
MTAVDGRVVVGSLVEAVPQENGEPMRKRKKFVFRDDEKERGRVRESLSRALAINPPLNPIDPLWDDDYEWYGNWSGWRSLFPSQEEVLTAVQNAINNVENNSVSD